jgi:hypothetical protein
MEYKVGGLTKKGALKVMTFKTPSSQSGKRDSNPRPSAWEANALPTELFPRDVGGTKVKKGFKKSSLRQKKMYFWVHVHWLQN